MKNENVIVLEDDMVLSPDFLSYFNALEPFLRNDPSIFCISSWNDFGQMKYSKDPKRIFRTSYFPGLGWMLNKRIWVELSPKFPSNMWDDWMRSSWVHLNRDCLVPEVSRTKNIGQVGSNVNPLIFQEKLSKKAFNKKEIIDYGDLSYLELATYDASLRERISGMKVLRSLKELKDILQEEKKIDGSKPQDYLFIFSSTGLHSLLGFLELPYQELRSHHHYLAEIPNWKGQDGRSRLLLAHESKCPFVPDPYRKRPDPNLVIIKGPKGYNCEKTCKLVQKRCQETQFDFVNECSELGKHFPCKKCGIQMGEDIPNFVDDVTNEWDQWCLTTLAVIPTCAARHVSVKRLCPCV